MAFRASDNELDLESVGELMENPMLTRLNSIKAKGRLSFVTPTENEADTQFLTFKHTTKAQERTRKRQQPIKLEPLPMLKAYQDHKKPEYIYEQNRYRLITSGVLKPPGSTEERSSTKSLVQFEREDSVKKKKQVKRSYLSDILPFLVNQTRSKPSHFSSPVQVTERLEEFRNEAKEVVRKACRVALRAAGFMPDDCAYEPIEVNSASSLLNYLTDKLKRTPSADVIQKWITEEKPEVTDKKGAPVLEKQEEDESLIPMFVTELILTVQSLLFEPPLEDFLDGISGAINHFRNTVLSVPNLVPDSYFDAFTSPYINNKLEEKTCGFGPSLSAVFDDDKNFHTIIFQIKETIQAAFESAQLYAATFEKFQIFFKENESLDLQALKLQEPDVKFFSEQLEKYHRQHKDAVALRRTRNVGLLLIDTKQLKEKLIPSPLRCLEVLNYMLPRLSKKKVDALVSEAQDAEYKLEFVPTTTIEYVNNLVFLDEIQERIESLEDEGNVVVQMYKLIEQYQVPTPPEDFAVFVTMKPSIVAVRNAIDKSVGDRETSVKQFCLHLGRDLEDLSNEVNEIKLLAQDPQILDINADQDKVHVMLNDLQSVLDDLQKRAFQYKSYQKNFKVEVSKFEALEEVSAELKLKQLLWDSLSEWDQLQQEWLKCFVFQLPVIINLRNPTLKPRHWAAIEQTVDATLVDLDIPLTLEKLSELHVFDFGREIQDISGQASGEAALETVLKKVNLKNVYSEDQGM
ncbi:hypothetical protein E2I00_012481 [Balaenoptera physalus]|uniref:Dynein heavy chain linker domain-containing protein n=1 Tax=Balaenoptera physalus TaxID=9770 RepID=A0A6A1Q750_BALPH|nr:hypothetical protein E2I00_012481 [Balaenoptera physalus]